MAFYYIGENAGDYDWTVNLKSDKAVADFNKEYSADIEKNYQPERNEKVLNKAYKSVNVSIAKRNAEAE